MADTLPAAPKAALTPAQQSLVLNILRRAAAAEILPRFRSLSGGDIATKSGPDDLVTTADTAAERMITRALQSAFPSAVIVGEEACAADPALIDRIAEAPLAFILDPVDGTWNFAHGLAVFGVILAVTRFGRPAFGLIYDPVADDWAIADDQGPAWLERARGASRPLAVAPGKEVAALTGFVPLHHFAPHHRAQVAATLPGFARTQTLRCSAHEYRMVAQGQVDFLLTAQLKPWDHAAGVLICERAGAHAELLDGSAYTAARHEGHLLVAPDKTTWNRIAQIFAFLND